MQLDRRDEVHRGQKFLQRASPREMGKVSIPSAAAHLSFQHKAHHAYNLQ